MKRGQRKLVWKGFSDRSHGLLSKEGEILAGRPKGPSTLQSLPSLPSLLLPSLDSQRPGVCCCCPCRARCSVDWGWGESMEDTQQDTSYRALGELNAFSIQGLEEPVADNKDLVNVHYCSYQCFTNINIDCSLKLLSQSRMHWCRVRSPRYVPVKKEDRSTRNINPFVKTWENVNGSCLCEWCLKRRWGQGESFTLHVVSCFSSCSF